MKRKEKSIKKLIADFHAKDCQAVLIMSQVMQDYWELKGDHYHIHNTLVIEAFMRLNEKLKEFYRKEL